MSFRKNQIKILEIRVCLDTTEEIISEWEDKSEEITWNENTERKINRKYKREVKYNGEQKEKLHDALSALSKSCKRENKETNQRQKSKR